MMGTESDDVDVDGHTTQLDGDTDDNGQNSGDKDGENEL